MPAFGLIHLRSLLSASIALLLGLVAVTSQAQTITFEKLPDNSDPVDNLQLPLNTVFQVGRTGLSFGFDTNGDKIADQGVVMEHAVMLTTARQSSAGAIPMTSVVIPLTPLPTKTTPQATRKREGTGWFEKRRSVTST